MKILMPKPYDAQLPVLTACFDNETTFITLNGSRQVGKTFLSTICALKWALDDRDQNIMIVSPTDGQVKKIYKQMILMITPLLWFVKSYKIQSGDSEIIFKNGSTILFRSALSENTLRGYSNTHLILDECAFIKEQTWNTILAPTLTVKGKKCLFCSTPKGNNFFSRLFHKGISGDDITYKSFKLTYFNNPYANVKFINDQKVVLPDEIFRQEYLGEFIDSAGCFRGIEELCILNKQTYNSNKQYYIGVDIALKNDYTVAICFNNNKEMVDYIRFNQTDTLVVIDKLKTFFKKWNPSKILMESNNQGLPIIQMMVGEGVRNIETFSTTATSKKEIINRLIAIVGKREIKLLKDDIIISEFNAFTATLTKTGGVKFEAAYGHDDIVMATAIAVECFIVNQFTSGFVMVR